MGGEWRNRGWMATEQSGQIPQRNGVVAAWDLRPRKGCVLSEEIPKAFLHASRNELEERMGHRR